MYNRKKKLKEFLTREEYEVVVQNATNFSDTPLPVWHLEIMEKCLSELSNFDLIRCIRQDVFTNLATFEIIVRIDENNTPFYADIDSLELMEKLSSVSSEILLTHMDELIRMIDNIEKRNLIDLADVWMFDEQKETYKGYVDMINRKIH
ncbi:contact-dependent growth inhibition system immunity protein [Paenibacillus sp. NFR01]|uniref:contact-dependent growth inhibition system immunity protein n=1 Tax=Paenibacillus sp. NFR01 TaxID=1566279 RepID=UPI000B82AF26|nr:contact-dependent growth inhibition system immunity protein [Paenibacillus sp. NFR01]